MELRKSLRRKKLLFYAIAYICLLTPMLTLCIINRDVYFVKNKGGFSVGLGGMMSGVFIVSLMKTGFKKLNKAMSASMLLVIVWCFETIINDLLAIVFCYWLGIMLFTVFEIPAKHYKNNLTIYNNEVIKDTAREEIAVKKAKKQPELLEGGRV